MLFFSVTVAKLRNTEFHFCICIYSLYMCGHMVCSHMCAHVHVSEHLQVHLLLATSLVTWNSKEIPCFISVRLAGSEDPGPLVYPTARPPALRLLTWPHLVFNGGAGYMNVMFAQQAFGFKTCHYTFEHGSPTIPN